MTLHAAETVRGRTPRVLPLATLISILVVALPAQLLAAPTLNALLSPLSAAQRAELTSAGRIVANLDRPDFTLTPNSVVVAPLRQALAELQPNIAAESLVFLPGRFNDAARIAVLNRFLRLKEYEQIWFFSERHQERHRVFYHSDRVADPVSKRPLPDLQIETLTPELRIYALQDFPPLGFAVSEYRIEYHAASGVILFSSETLESLSWGALPLIRPGNLKIRVAVIPVEEGILIYGLGGVRAMGARLVYNRITAPFQGRVMGILQWVENTIREAMLR